MAEWACHLCICNCILVCTFLKMATHVLKDTLYKNYIKIPLSIC